MEFRQLSEKKCKIQVTLPITPKNDCQMQVNSPITAKQILQAFNILNATLFIL